MNTFRKYDRRKYPSFAHVNRTQNPFSGTRMDFYHKILLQPVCQVCVALQVNTKREQRMRMQ